MTKCPKCGGSHIEGVQYPFNNPERYNNGASEYKCINCGYRQGRWTKKPLEEGFVEPCFGRGGKPVKKRYRKLPRIPKFRRF